MAAADIMARPLLTTGSSSKTFLPPKRFKVKNVDDKERIIQIGYLEVTETEVTFTYEYHPTEVICWPLTCVRKYGISADTKIFALEAGRRAPSGEGIFAFKTDEAREINKRIDFYVQNRVQPKELRGDT